MCVGTAVPSLPPGNRHPARPQAGATHARAQAGTPTAVAPFVQGATSRMNGGNQLKRPVTGGREAGSLVLLRHVTVTTQATPTIPTHPRQACGMKAGCRGGGEWAPLTEHPTWLRTWVLMGMAGIGIYTHTTLRSAKDRTFVSLQDS